MSYFRWHSKNTVIGLRLKVCCSRAPGTFGQGEDSFLGLPPPHSLKHWATLSPGLCLGSEIGVFHMCSTVPTCCWCSHWGSNLDIRTHSCIQREGSRAKATTTPWQGGSISSMRVQEHHGRDIVNVCLHALHIAAAVLREKW